MYVKMLAVVLNVDTMHLRLLKHMRERICRPFCRLVYRYVMFDEPFYNDIYTTVHAETRSLNKFKKRLLLRCIHHFKSD